VRELVACADAEFGVDACERVADGPLAEAECDGDLFVAASVGDERGDVALARSSRLPNAPACTTDSQHGSGTRTSQDVARFLDPQPGPQNGTMTATAAMGGLGV
jgi:hypothetical protein